jgi:hypothetical protein
VKKTKLASGLEIVELELSDGDLGNPGAYLAKVNAWNVENFALLHAEVQALKDPNHSKIAERLELMEKTVAAAHAKAVEAFEKSVILEKAKPDIDRNLDLRLFGTLALNHDPAVLNFKGDAWYKSKFTSSEPGENASRRLFFNLLTCDMDDLAGFDDKSVALLNRLRALNDRLTCEDVVARHPKSEFREAYLKAGGMKSLQAWKAWENLAHQMKLSGCRPASRSSSCRTSGPSWR